MDKKKARQLEKAVQRARRDSGQAMDVDTGSRRRQRKALALEAAQASGAAQEARKPKGFVGDGRGTTLGGAFARWSARGRRRLNAGIIPLVGPTIFAAAAHAITA